MSELMVTLRTLSRKANEERAMNKMLQEITKKTQLEAKLRKDLLLINELMILIAKTGATQFTTNAITIGHDLPGIGPFYQISYATHIKICNELIKLFEKPSEELINKILLEGYSVKINHDEGNNIIRNELVITWF